MIAAHDPDHAPFFAAAERHELVVQRCRPAGHVLHLPRGYCAPCDTHDVVWSPVVGDAVVHSWTIVEHGVDPSFPVPYTVALVELVDPSGVRFVTNLTGRPELVAGQAMRLGFESRGCHHAEMGSNAMNQRSIESAAGTPMAFRQLGRSGLQVSAVGLGCNNFRARLDDEQARAVIDAALDHGITLFDTADVYGNGGGSEVVLGEILGSRRDRVVLATKGGLPMPGEPPDEPRGSRRYLHRAVRASLRRLGTDHIDLYQLHAPDPVTPVDETIAAFDELIQQGLIRYAGSSNYAAWQLVEADWAATASGRPRFISAQYEYHLLHRAPEVDVVDVCDRYGLGTLPFFPLANGLLTGKYRKGQPLPADSRLGRDSSRAERLLAGDAIDRVEALRAVADEAGLTMIELAIGWLLAQPTVASVIAGASTPAQVAANAAVAARPALSPAVLAAIDHAAPP